jgi:hypothetical protein
MLIFGLLLTGCPTDNSGTTPRVTRVTINEPTVTLKQGDIYTGFSADVDADDGAKKVLWDITGAENLYTNISHTTGVLVISPDEPPGVSKITVTATSTVDDTKFGTATVTIESSPANGRITTTTTNFRRGGKITFTATDITPPLTWTVTGNPLSRTGFAHYEPEENSNEVNLSINNPESTTLHSVDLMIDSDEPVGKELLVTVTSQQEPFNTATYSLTVMDKPEVTGITITADPAAVWLKGQPSEIRFTATVLGEVDRDTTVTWSIPGNQVISGTAINQTTRVLTIADSQTDALTVTAKSSDRNLTVRTATLTVKPMVPVVRLTLHSNLYYNVNSPTRFKDHAVGETWELPVNLAFPDDNLNNTVSPVIYLNSDSSLVNNDPDKGFCASDKVTWSVAESDSSKVDIKPPDVDGKQSITGLTKNTTVRLIATIKEGKGPGEDYTQNFSLNIKAVNSGLGVSYPGYTDDGSISIVGSSQRTLSSTNPEDEVEITNPATYDRFIWVIDGVTVGNESSYHLSKSDFSVGMHYLTAIAYKDDRPYSTEVSISVSN